MSDNSAVGTSRYLSWSVEWSPDTFDARLELNGENMIEGDLSKPPPWDSDDARSVQAWLEAEVDRRWPGARKDAIRDATRVMGWTVAIPAEEVQPGPDEHRVFYAGIERQMPHAPVTSAEMQIRSAQPNKPLSLEAEAVLANLLADLGRHISAELPEIEWWVVLKAHMSLVWSKGSEERS